MVTKKLSKKEMEKVVLDLYNDGLTSEKIGLVLRDKHGVKNFREEFGLKISEVIGKNDADQKNISRNLDNLRRHFDTNKKDQPAKRRLIKTAAHLKTIQEYMTTRV